MYLYLFSSNTPVYILTQQHHIDVCVCCQHVLHLERADQRETARERNGERESDWVVEDSG